MIDNQQVWYSAETYLEFFINSTKTGTYGHEPTGTGHDGFLYDVPVYTNTSLPSGAHNFTIATVPAGDRESVFLFDYLEYT